MRSRINIWINWCCRHSSSSSSPSIIFFFRDEELGWMDDETDDGTDGWKGRPPQAYHIHRSWILSHWHQASTGKALASKKSFGHCSWVNSFGFFKKITFIYSGSLLTMNRSARRTSRASFSLLGEVLKTVTVIPKAFPNLIAMWPKPPKSTTPKCLLATSI